jgi:hypothetical protein
MGQRELVATRRLRRRHHQSLACSERLTMAYTSKASGWSRPLLPDHAELAASEQAERDAARARRSLRRAMSARFDNLALEGTV